MNLDAILQDIRREGGNDMDEIIEEVDEATELRSTNDEIKMGDAFKNAQFGQEEETKRFTSTDKLETDDKRENNKKLFNTSAVHEDLSMPGIKYENPLDDNSIVETRRL